MSEIISTNIIKDFNLKADLNRKELHNRIKKIVERTDISDEMKNDMKDVITEIMNRMEIARRVFNNFAITGKVEVPD